MEAHLHRVERYAHVVDAPDDRARFEQMLNRPDEPLRRRLPLTALAAALVIAAPPGGADVVGCRDTGF